MEFYERACGARLHSAYIRPGGVGKDITEVMLNDIKNFTKIFNYRLDEIEDLLNTNRIWVQRLKDIGIVTRKHVND
jgi:NADH:ubiquinone oxidoreductase subunit D